MKKFLLLLLSFSLLIRCSSNNSSEDSEQTNVVNTTSTSDNTNQDYPNFIDSMKMRIFAKEGVSVEFLNNVGKTYEAMFGEGPNVDENMRSIYLKATEDNYVYQRLGIDGSEESSNFEPGDPPAPYNDNVTDFIWEMAQGGPDQIGEVIEHLLHTITNVILYLSFPEEWDYNNPSSLLSLAMQESIDKEIYDISSYDELLDNDPEIYNSGEKRRWAFWKWRIYFRNTRRNF